MDDINNNEAKDKIVHLDADEFKYLSVVSDFFLQNSKVEESPIFIVVAGGPCAGKTTFINKEYNNGYVLIDAAQIHLKLTDNESRKVEKYNAYFDFIGMQVVSAAIEGKKNIVVEIIMDKSEPIQSIMDKMIEKGYKVNVKFIECDPVEAWKRNLNRAKHNISAVYTQDQTLSWFVRYLGLE